MLGPWLTSLKSQFSARIAKQSLSGGILLLGDPGLGALPFAKELAGVMLCEERGEIACGHCSGCRWVSQDQHPDLFVLAPEADSAIIKIDAIRELSAALTQKSARGGSQVVIITQTESLNIASSNAILKTLEEPTGDVVFFLCCRDKRVLLPTIISRCEQVSLPNASIDQARDWLLNKHPDLSSPEQWLRWARFAPYGVSALVDVQYDHWRNRVLDDLLAIAGKVTDVLSLSSAWQKAAMPVLFDVLMSVLGDVIRVHSGGEDSVLVHQDSLVKMHQLASLVSPSSAWQYYNFLLKTRDYWQRGVSNERLLCDELALRFESDLDKKNEELVC